LIVFKSGQYQTNDLLKELAEFHLEVLIKSRMPYQKFSRLIIDKLSKIEKIDCYWIPKPGIVMIGIINLFRYNEYLIILKSIPYEKDSL